MELMNKIIQSLQVIDKNITDVIDERDQLKNEIDRIRNENDELKKRMQIVYSEMEDYLKELKEIREYYVRSNNSAQ